MVLGAFSEFPVTVDDIITESDTVGIQLTKRGTHNSEFIGIDPTSQEVEYQSLAFLRLGDGKVAERWSQPNQLGVMDQLGVGELPAA